MRIKYTVGIFSHILFSKEKISNFKLCSYSSNETYRIVKYLSHNLKEFKSKILAFTIGIVIVYLHVQNEEILAYIYLQHYHIAVRQFKVDLQTNNQEVSFLFSWKNITFQIFFGAFAKGFFACSQLLEFGRQNDLHGYTDVNVS